MKKYLKLLRVKHYIKNILICLPLFFGCKLLTFNLLIKVVLSFLSFSFMCSVIYIINDLRDYKLDINDINKKFRPIASGKIKKKKAIIIALTLFIISVLINIIFVKNYVALILLILYFIINFSYSFGLKNVILVDIFLLMLGFLIRVYYGSVITNIAVSNWLYLTIMSFSFYLGLGKRRNELKHNKKIRDVLKKYNYEFLDKNMYMCLTLTIIFYSLWTINFSSFSNTEFLEYTVPLVLLICMKYSLNIEGSSSGDPVEVLLKDRVLFLLVIIYSLLLTVILYGKFMI